jgi:hypothetical protein
MKQNLRHLRRLLETLNELAEHPKVLVFQQCIQPLCESIRVRAVSTCFHYGTRAPDFEAFASASG